MSNQNLSRGIAETGLAINTGIATYFQGKSQSQLAKRNPQAFVQLKKQENKTAIILFFTFLAIFIVMIIVIVVLTITNKPKDIEPEDKISS
jgi:energy-coupling factor transporter transmembrane protein EcfT